MVGFPITQRPAENVPQLNGLRYHLATTEQLQGIPNVKRSWDVQPTSAQDLPIAQPFAEHLDFRSGYGFTFAPDGRGYELANGWDFAADKTATWPKHADIEGVTDTAYRGWWYFDFASGYLYLLRGRYATKYAPDDSGAQWSILEYHTLGTSGQVVCGAPATFKGKTYVPMCTASSGALLRWYELTTVTSAPVTEVQTVVVSGTPTSGTYTLTTNDGVNSYTTSALAFNAGQAAVQAALRALPGFQKVTVVTTGSTPNYTHTITMTAAPTADGTASPPQLTHTDSTSGGTHNIANATTVAGVGDTWTRGPSSVEAGYFCTWNKPTVGPVLVRTHHNSVSTVSDDPLTAADWSPDQPVTDSTFNLTAIAVLGRLLYCGAPNGLFSADEAGIIINEIPSISSALDVNNFVAMREHNGALLAPHKLGLIRFRTGASWGIIGAEEDGALEGQETQGGWGRTLGLAPYGKFAFTSINDLYNTIGAVTSLQVPHSSTADVYTSARAILAPHMHHRGSQLLEDVGICTLTSQPASPLPLTTWSDDAAVGTLAWSDPGNVTTDDVLYAAASGAGQTHYLKGLNLGIVIPTTAVIKGITARVKHATSQKGVPAIVGTPSQATQTTGSSLTWDHVTPAGENRVLTVIVSINTALGAFTVSGITAGGNALTLVGAQTLAAGFRNEIWRLVAPAVGTASVVVAFSGTAHAANGVGISLNNVHQSIPFGTAVGSNVSPGNSITLTTAAGDLALGVVTASGGVTVTPTSGQTDVLDVLNSAGADTHVQTQAVAGVSTTLTSTIGGSATTVALAVPVQQIDDPVIVDAVVKLVQGGSVVGSNLADAATHWPPLDSEVVYGGSTDLWGTTWTAAQVMAATFGFVLSATITAGEARVQYVSLEIAFAVPGVTDPASYLVVVVVDASGATASPVVYKLPGAGQPVANDPRVPQFVSEGALLHTARIYGQTRATPKRYSTFEVYAEIAPAVAGGEVPGVRFEAQLDDGGVWYPLFDADGQSTFAASGQLELFFPQQASVGTWVQLRVVIDAIAGVQVGMSCVLRDPTLRGYVLSRPGDIVQAVLVLAAGQQYADGTVEGARSERDMRREITAMLEPNPLDPTPTIQVYDPLRRMTYPAVLQQPRFVEVSDGSPLGSTTAAILTFLRLRGPGNPS